MCLKNKLRFVIEQTDEILGLFVVVLNDVVIAELHSRLHDKTDHAGEGGFETRLLEEIPMNIDRLSCSRPGGGLESSQNVIRATRGRDLGTDDIERHLMAGRFRDFLSNGCESQGTFSRCLIVECSRFTFATRRGVEVDLAKAGLDIGGYHRFGLLHRLLGRTMTPGIGPQMVAAKNDAVSREPLLVGNPADQRGEVSG